MSTDTIIESNTQKLIIDTKFSKTTLQSSHHSDKQTAKSDNLYQLFAYVINEAHNIPEKKISGMLLYPRVDKSVAIDYSLLGHMFYVRTVDLNQDFEEIKNELQNMMMDIFIGVEYIWVWLA